MKELYERLEQYMKFDRGNTIFFTILMSILLLTCGAIAGLLLEELSTNGSLSPLYTTIFLFGITIYIMLEIRKIKKEKNFPISILEHLCACEDLKGLKKKFDRKRKVFEYIDNSIQALNNNTCPITGAPHNNLCQQELELGLKAVIIDLIDRPSYFYDIDKTKFTIGVFLDEITEKDSSTGMLVAVQKRFIFRNDLNFEEFVPQDEETSNEDDQTRFFIKVLFKETRQFEKFMCKDFMHQGKSLTIMSSPIPNVCERCPSIGVIFTIYEGMEICSEDTHNILLICGRILSNWISKYEDCLYHDNKSKIEIIPENEMSSLGDFASTKASPIVHQVTPIGKL